jgi:outer membrane immunogenic protein
MSHSRNLLLASVALCAIASTALAADLPTMKGPPPAPVAAPYSWTGFNIGVQGGYGWGDENDNLSATDFAVVADHFNANGAIGGAHVGYDQQFGSLVLGVRGELDASDLSGSITKMSFGGGCVEGCDVSLSFHNTWQAFLLARAGIAFDRLLVYATGGLAVGDDRESVRATHFSTVWTGAQTDTLVGGAIGLGAEYAFDEHWRLGAEWRYANFGRGNYSATSTGFPPVVNYKAGFSENLALVDLSYRF